jgi:hypothetical protein
MHRVLIPSDNRDFVVELARTYHRLGWDAVVGRQNFELETGRYDLVHFQWPEELCGWKPPSQEQMDQIFTRIEWWSQRSRLLITVHNLLPHRDSEHPAYRRLFEGIYERIPVLGHFSETSRRLTCTHFPHADRQRNVVTGFFNWDGFLPKQRNAGAARDGLGIKPGEFVILVFGAIREWEEVQLVRRGFERAQIKGKRLLMAGRYQEDGPVWRQRWRRWAWRRWLRGAGAVVAERFLPDEEVHTIVDAADVLLIPRLKALNSGLPGLAATFGKVWVAPDCGAFPELDSLTHNPLYRTGDSGSLSRALEESFHLDRQAIAVENRKLADSWKWETIVSTGVTAVGIE